MFDAGSVVARLTLDKKDWDRSISQIQNNVSGLSARMTSLGTEMMSTGRSINQVGSRLTMLGGMIMAPVALMVNQLAKENMVLQNKLDNVSRSFKELGSSLIGYIIPYIDRLSGMVKGLSDGFNRLPDSVRRFAVDFAIISSALLITTGLAAKIIGLFSILSGAIIKVGAALLLFAQAHPLVALATAVAVIALNFDKLKDILPKLAVAIGTTFSSSILAIIDMIGAGVWKLMAAIIGLLEKIPFLGGVFKSAMDSMRVDCENLAAAAWKSAGAETQAWIDAWSGLVPKHKEVTEKMLNEWQSFNAGINMGLKEQVAAFSNFGNMAKELVANTFTTMSNTVSTVFFDLMTGKFQNLQQVAADFGNSLIKMFADLVAKLVIYAAIVLPLTAMFPELKTALTVGSMFGFAEGTDSVPQTGMYKLHEGEKVTPKYDANSSKDQAITIINQITPGFVNAAIAMDPGTVINVINQDILYSRTTRKTIQRRR
jgi:hypothetical protein